MASGLLALLDDVAALVKVTAATLDDLPAIAMKAGSKAAGVVVDDTAVTPKYVVGLSAAREVPIVLNIAKGSLKNKFLFLLPAAIALGAFAPFLITPLLMVGGVFLCFEGYEKLHGYFHDETPNDEMPEITITPEQLEAERTGSAIRTDFILSAEIMAITLGAVSTEPLLTKILVLAVVALGITVAVYGVVALIVKADDFGLHLAKDKHSAPVKALGRTMVLGLPYVLSTLSVVGTAAMLWVGGGIIIHGVPAAHHALEALGQSVGGGFMGWFTQAAVSAVFGIAMGFVAVLGFKFYKKITSRG